MYKKFALLCGPLVTVAPVWASAPADTVSYRPAEPWVLEAPKIDDSASKTDTPVRVRYLDNQIRIAPDGTEEVFVGYQINIQKPEALSAGNLTVAWQPENGPITVHYLRLIRDGKPVDILSSTKFTILRREAQLEQSMLTGQRTATLQVPGLQVGDELAFAYTIRRRQPVFDGKVAGLMQMPLLGVQGAFRFRLLWPADRKMTLKGNGDLPELQPVTTNGQNILDLTIRDPKGAVPTDGAPPRYNVRRLIEYTDFGSWNEISQQFAPLYDKAATLSPNSPIRAEAAAIAARTNDPSERAMAALQLVEDRIRYVYVGLDGGNYAPANADETWSRRFGDCKAKTVLLMAILHELGIEAKPALVSSLGGDGLDQRLPAPELFDHVIVRATIAGRAIWLDGTRQGDTSLELLPSPFRWALPLIARGTSLEQIAPRDVVFPMLTGIMDIDAAAGVDQDARVTAKNILRGDDAVAINAQLSGLSADDADRMIKGYWQRQMDWATPDKVSWSYDKRRMALSLDFAGRGNPGWTGDASSGHSLTIPGAGFYKPDVMRRPTDQDQLAKWAVPFPRFRCWATTIRLPKAGNRLAWSLYAEPMNERLGGIAYWRASGMNGNIVRTVMSSHSYEAEATSQEAATNNRAIPNFNNNMSSISERAAGAIKASPVLPFDDSVDWLNAPTPCDARSTGR